jgi:hypothetical protein
MPDPAPSGGRRLMRRCDRAALATTLAGTPPSGAPYVSLVLVAFDFAAAPLLLLSDLAQHTKNFRADPRVALLFDGTGAYADPLAGPRLSVMGRIEESADASARARFLARHPSAELYAGLADFHLYRVAVERGHEIAGFGRIAWIEGAELGFAGAAPALAAAEGEIVRHMNADHAAALTLYAQRLLGRDGTGWRMTGIDPEGADLRRDGETARLDFADPVLTPAAARAALIALAERARA